MYNIEQNKRDVNERSTEKEPIRYIPKYHENIKTTAENMIKMAKETGRDIVACFNVEGADFTVPGDSDFTVEQVEKLRDEATEAYFKKLQEDPEYQRKQVEKAEKERQEKEEKEIKKKKLIEEFPNLDLKNCEKIVTWLCEFEKVADGFDPYILEVISLLENNGYKEKEGEAEEIDMETKESQAKLIIGRILWLLKNGFLTIHPIIHDWNDKLEKNFPDKK